MVTLGKPLRSDDSLYGKLHVNIGISRGAVIIGRRDTVDFDVPQASAELANNSDRS